MLFTKVNPETFIVRREHTPAHGRGSWNKTGKANGSWRYEYIKGKPKIGSNAEQSLDAWATCAGSYGFQLLLIDAGYLRPLEKSEMGLYGQLTLDAVKKMQGERTDPETGAPLDVDGTIGQSDARALVTPILDLAEAEFAIPDHYLRGETNQESRLDLGSLGYYIYYGITQEYRGVDRGISQINSAANPQVSWAQAFDPFYALRWSGARMFSYYDKYKKAYRHQPDSVLWDAALCAHNNPSAAGAWAKSGMPPTTAAATYVNNAKAARY